MTESNNICRNFDKYRTLLRIISVIFIFIIFRILLISTSSLSGDEGVFGLMALAIGKGEEFPLYCWSAHYASALISYLAVPVFYFLNVSSFTLKLTTIIYGIFLIPLIYLFIKQERDNTAGLISSLAVAIPVPLILSLSVTANGGYAETFFLGFAIWISGLGIIKNPSAFAYFIFGILSGISFSVLWLGVPFILSVLITLYIEKKLFTQKILWASIGALLGLLPFIYYNTIITKGATIMRLGARAVRTNSSAEIISGLSTRIYNIPIWFDESYTALKQVFPSQFGVALPAAFIISIIYGSIKLIKNKSPYGTLVISFLFSLIIFNFAGNLSRDRHWCTLYFTFIPAWLGLSRRTHIIFLSLLLLYTTSLSVTEITNRKPDSKIESAALSIAKHNSDLLISDYDLGYPIAFELKGNILLSTTAPPNPSDRRPDWTQAGRAKKDPAILLPIEKLNEFIFESNNTEMEIEFISDRALIFPQMSGNDAIEIIQKISK